MGIAFLVLGPESSGTRCATQLLIAAGCHGDAGLEQRFDRALPDGVSPVVWRRSVPHGGKWPDITEMATMLRDKGYESRAIVTTRDWYPTTMSQTRIGHVPSKEKATANLRKAYPFIFSHLEKANVPFWTLSYEALIVRPRKVAAKLMEMIGLSAPDSLDIYDGNAKYYTD